MPRGSGSEEAVRVADPPQAAPPAPPQDAGCGDERATPVFQGGGGANGEHDFEGPPVTPSRRAGGHPGGGSSRSSPRESGPPPGASPARVAAPAASTAPHVAAHSSTFASGGVAGAHDQHSPLGTVRGSPSREVAAVWGGAPAAPSPSREVAATGPRHSSPAPPASTSQAARVLPSRRAAVAFFAGLDGGNLVPLSPPVPTGGGGSSAATGSAGPPSASSPGRPAGSSPALAAVKRPAPVSASLSSAPVAVVSFSLAQLADVDLDAGYPSPSPSSGSGGPASVDAGGVDAEGATAPA